MKILKFFENYPDEMSCKLAYKAKREAHGIVCKKCGSDSHKWKKKRMQWECKQCAYRTTLKSGTVMEHSKMSFQYWFIAMHFLTSTTKSFSAKEIQKQLGHNRYEPIWSMLHKIRSVMGIRDQSYTLIGDVEIDEGFFETVSINRSKDEKLKRGRGSQKQTAVFVSAESKEVLSAEITPKYQKKKRLGFVKMTVINSLKKKEIASVVKATIEKGSCLTADGSNSYNDLKTDYQLDSKVVPKQEVSKVLPWVHTAISNAKRLLLDVHHRIDDDYLQNYLNEFCYKLNRRYFSNLFDRILNVAVSERWDYLGETCG